MTEADYDLAALAEKLQQAIDELGPSLSALTALALMTNAVIGLLSERGLLPVLDVRDRALDLADAAGLPTADARAAIDRMLPEGAQVAAGLVN